MNFWLTIYRFSWVLIVILVIAVVIGLFVPKSNPYREMHEKKLAYQEEIRRKEDEIRLLRARQNRFQTDPAYVERTARQIGLVKTNETVFRVTNEVPAAAGAGEGGQ